MSKYGFFSGPFFPVFSLNIGKYRPEKNSVFGHVLHSAIYKLKQNKAKKVINYLLLKSRKHSNTPSQKA